MAERDSLLVLFDWDRNMTRLRMFSTVLFSLSISFPSLTLSTEVTVENATDGEATSMGWAGPLTNEEAWKAMPSSSKGSGSPLPAWIRVVARQMPKTAAAFLQLDYAQRSSGPVEPKLRAAMRWTSAKSNGCDYSMQVALADLQRAGATDLQVSGLTSGSMSSWSESELAALRFAFVMTVDSDRYPDEDFARLVSIFDANTAGSMVLHMSYSNFQDRFLNCIGAQSFEVDKPLPPLEVAFDINDLIHKPPTDRAAATAAAPKPSLLSEVVPTLNVIEHESTNTWLGYEALQSRLIKQRQRESRLPSLPWSQIAPKLPVGLMDKPSDIAWYQLAFGYAPELAVPFEVYLRAAGSEVTRNWDRVFGGSLFWMVTNSVKCPYCMGHCEMNWEVAGLTADEIAGLSKSLAGNDWGRFTPGQQHALAFAKKITQSPSSINRNDMNQLRKELGDERAFYVALNCSRYNYMTRVSNGFQLTLESENVFWDYYGLPRPEKK